MSTTTTQNLDYAIIPLDSVEVSSNVDGHEAVKLFDGNLQTYWTPSLQQTSFAQVNFLKPHLVKGVDLAFNKGDKRRHTFQISIMSPTTNRWIGVSVYETKGTTTEPIRVNLPDVSTKSVRVTFLSHIEDGHMGIVPEVSELRVYGEITADEAPDAAKIPDLQCPQGYVKDSVTNRCVKDVQYEFLNPTNVTGKSTDDNSSIENNDPKNVVNDDTSNSYTVIGAGSKITQEFDKEYEVTAINLDIINQQKAEYNFTVVLPTKQIPVLLQSDLSSTNIVLDDPVRANKVELILASTTAADQTLSVVKMNVLGNINTTTAPPISQEPADKGVERIGYDNDISKWTAVNMTTPPTAGKIVDVNKKNVRTNYASKANAQLWLDWKKAQTPNPDHTCPQGQHWDAAQNKCVDDPISHDCPAGQHWDEASQKCVDNTQPEGGVDQFGVKLIYPATSRNYTGFKDNKRSDGYRMDLTGVPSDVLSFEFHGYFAIDNVPDDEVSGKISIGKHSGDGAIVKCQDMGVGNKDGACRYRYENPHPTYTGSLGSGIAKGVPLGSKFVGYKFIRLTKGSDNYLEIWQDAGSNEGTTPANQWKQLANWKLDSKYCVNTYPIGPQVTLRLDGSNVSADLKKKWLNCVEVKP